MSEAPKTPVSTPAPRAKHTATPSSGAPKVETPEPDKMEIPAALRDIAEKGVTQAKEAYEKIRSVAEEATDALEDTYGATTKGLSELSLKLIETARENTNSAFDFATQLIAVKSVSEAVELSTTHTRKRYETVTAQTKELGAMAQKVAVDAVEPVKERLSKVFKAA